MFVFLLQRVNPDYKARLSALSNLVLVKFLKDTMVQLGIARKTLYDKMKKHGLDKAEFKD